MQYTSLRTNSFVSKSSIGRESRLKLFREISLDNGLAVKCFDESQHYFGEYYRVRVVLTININPCTISSDHRYRVDEVHDKACFRKSFERMGVRRDDVDRVTEELVDDF